MEGEDPRLGTARVWYDLWKNYHEIITLHCSPPPFDPSAPVTVMKGEDESLMTANQHERIIKIKRVNLISPIKRFFIYTLPELSSISSEVYDLIIFYHGARGNAYEQVALTNLASYLRRNIITVYGQCSGEMEEPYIHPNYNHIAYGEIYWEIRDSDPSFLCEIEYTEAIIQYMRANYRIRSIFTIGHSNGGVFNLQLAIHLPNVFSGIVSHQGGVGYDPGYYLDFSCMKEDDKKTPLLFYTGTDDIHREPCQWAASIFADANFPVDLFIEEGAQHKYLSSAEDYMINWLINICSPNL